MGAKEKIVICCDEKEKCLARSLQGIIKKYFESFKIKLCATPQALKNRDWKRPFAETRFIFVLCSPYSIGQQGINFVSGVATMHAGENNMLIPVCHSGQKSKELPHYLLTRQTLTIESYRFVEDLFQLLSGRKFGPSDFRSDEVKVLEQDNVLKKIKEAIDIKQTDESKDNFFNYVLVNADVFEKTYVGGKAPDEIKNLKKEFDKSKLQHVLKELNRRILEDKYGAPRQEKTPTQLKDDIIESLKKIHAKKKNIQSESSWSSPSPSLLTLKREDGIVSIVDHSSSSGGTDLGKCLEFLASEDDREINGIVISLGVQHCLFDGDNIYVGLRMHAEVDSMFCSFCQPQGIFEPGYQQQPPWLQDSFHSTAPYENEIVTSSNPVYYKLQERAVAHGIKLWRVEIDGETYIATIFANTTEAVPRLEIGLWLYIDISTKIHDKDQKDIVLPCFGEDKEPIKTVENATTTTLHYWIWVKDGEIHYWSWPSNMNIPRYVNPTNEHQRTNVLVSTEYMIETYGRPERYTPFASDDVLGVDNVVKEPFSAVARELLTIF